MTDDGGASWEDEFPVVFDNGTGMFKAGIAGGDAPDVVFPSIVGYPKGAGSKKDIAAVGDACLDPPGAYKLFYPMEHGVVLDWDSMEAVWREAYKQLEVDPTNQAVLMTEPALNPRKNREQMLELIFEKFKAPAAYVAVQAVMSLYSGGKNTGTVVDIGDGVSHYVPVFEGHTVRNAILRTDLAGRDLTQWLMELLSNDCKHPFTTGADREIARDIKEKHCFVSPDFDDDMAKIEENEACMDVQYTLPDGKTLFIGRPRFAGPEALFQPDITGREHDGVHQLTYDAIQRCDIDMRKPLYESIVLSGGTTMFEGMAERLEKEVTELAPVAAGVKVIAPSERKYSVWMGAAVLASLSTFQQQFITNGEYQEAGAAIVHRRCDTLVAALG